MIQGQYLSKTQKSNTWIYFSKEGRMWLTSFSTDTNLELTEPKRLWLAFHFWKKEHSPLNLSSLRWQMKIWLKTFQPGFFPNEHVNYLGSCVIPDFTLFISHIISQSSKPAIFSLEASLVPVSNSLAQSLFCKSPSSLTDHIRLLFSPSI